MMIEKIYRYDKMISRGGGTHQKKRSATFKSRGEIPIIKNVEVADTEGSYYAPTYLRRAKGLVKAGRARWSDDNFTKIVMFAGPAQNFEEANQMDIYDNDGNVTNKTEPAAKEDKHTTGPEISVGYILAQMEKIREDAKHIYEALSSVRDISPQPPSMNAADYASQAKAEAIGNIVQSRETTNQKLLAMYEKMYDDVKPVRTRDEATEVLQTEKMELLQGILQEMKMNPTFGHDFAPAYNEVFKSVFR